MKGSRIYRVFSCKQIGKFDGRTFHSLKLHRECSASYPFVIIFSLNIFNRIYIYKSLAQRFFPIED